LAFSFKGLSYLDVSFHLVEWSSELCILAMLFEVALQLFS